MLKFSQFIEENANQERVREKIKREKEADKLKHDRMMDQARRRDTTVANAKEEVELDEAANKEKKLAQLKKKEESLKDRLSLAKEKRAMQARKGKGTGRLQSSTEVRLNSQLNDIRVQIHALDEAKSPQDPDIKDRKGTQPAAYHRGLKKATKVKRDAHFKKHGSKSDSDPSAYQDAPGDKQARKEGMPKSKYTKYVDKMMDEACWKTHTQRGMKKKGNKMVPNCVPKEEVVAEEGTSFADKAKKSGISASTLRKVYNRGVAAWKTGHRPGTTPQQWGHARVNAFIAKKKKGGLNHDKDLA